MGASGDDPKERGFTIVDRRGAEEPPEAPESPREAGAPAALPPVDFSSFLLSLATSALYHLGLVADPETGRPGAPDLPLARQTIDTLAMLEEKTRGNLDQEEQRLLKSILAELRLRFVEAGKQG
jgi:hypothetical protein